MSFNHKTTVFTPTYNRAYILHNLYHSLQRQTCRDFEWLIVDDGSTDNTEALVTSWIAEDNDFPIRYYKQPNGGKHRAINNAVQLAQSFLFFIVDSDDQLTEDAIETIVSQIKSLPTDSYTQYAGICNCRGSSGNTILGTTFSGEWLDCTALDRSKHGIEGDKAEVFFTDIMRKYPFPEFPGENFVTEAVVWDRMAVDGYLLRFFNKTVYLCEYRDDGLTSQGLDLYYRNPQGYGLYLRQCKQYQKLTPANSLHL